MKMQNVMKLNREESEQNSQATGSQVTTLNSKYLSAAGSSDLNHLSQNRSSTFNKRNPSELKYI